MNQLSGPSLANQPGSPGGDRDGLAKKLLIILAVVAVFAAVAFFVARSEPETPPASEQTPPVSVGTEPDSTSKPELTAEQIRQLLDDYIEVAEADPDDPAATEAALNRSIEIIDDYRAILATIEVQPVDNYAPVTDIGQRYKDLIVEGIGLKDRYLQLANCQLPLPDLERLVVDLEPFNARALGLSKGIVAALDSGQDNTDLLADLKRLAPAVMAIDVELYDALPPNEIPAAIASCYN